MLSFPSFNFVALSRRSVWKTAFCHIYETSIVARRSRIIGLQEVRGMNQQRFIPTAVDFLDFYALARPK
jgi:hypothetical protein